MERDSIDRRQVLATTGAALAAGLAGCSGDGGGNGGGDNGGDDPTDSPTEGGGTPAGQSRAVEYLNADPAARNFGGSVTDATGQSEVTVDVGAGSDGLAFGPAAVVISAGTTVSWQWSGEGGQHNVVSTTSDTYESGDFSSDFDIDSGDPKESGDPFEQSFDDTGVALYHCEPHATVGMKGAVVVVE